MQKSLQDLGRVIEELERFLRRRAVRRRFTRLERRAQNRLRRGVYEIDRYIHKHPWQTIGIAAAASFVLGALVTRRD